MKRTKMINVITLDKENYTIVRKTYRCDSKKEAIDKFLKNMRMFGPTCFVTPEYLRAFYPLDAKDAKEMANHCQSLLRKLRKKLAVDSKVSKKYHVSNGDKSCEISLSKLQKTVLESLRYLIPVDIFNIKIEEAND